MTLAGMAPEHLPGAFSPEEVAYLLSRAEEAGFVDDPTKKRTASQAWVSDAGLALWLQLRLAPKGRTPAGVYSEVRFYRYEEGQTFEWHVDGTFRQKGMASQVTLLICLEAAEEGGETHFQRWGRYSLKVGDVLMFGQRHPHRGCPPKKGRKTVLRADLMF